MMRNISILQTRVQSVRATYMVTFCQRKMFYILTYVLSKRQSFNGALLTYKHVLFRMHTVNGLADGSTNI